MIEAPIYVLGKPREAAIAEARALLDRVGLASRLNAMPHQLSGAVSSKLALPSRGRLAMQPDVILFDGADECAPIPAPQA